MLRRIGALGIALAVVMVPVMTAQNKPAQPAQPAAQAPHVTHASIGTVKQVDAKVNTIVVTPIGGKDHTYHFGAKTTVHGLPGTTSVTALATKTGEMVVVHYAVSGDKAEARSVEYLGAAQIQQFEGTVVKVDEKARTLTVEPATGAAETFVLAQGGALDLKSGIVSLTNFAHFTNVKATVYYAMRGKEKLVWYLQEAAAPAVSLR